MAKTTDAKSTTGDVEQTESTQTQAAGDVSGDTNVEIDTGDTNVEIDWSPWTKHFDWD